MAYRLGYRLYYVEFLGGTLYVWNGSTWVKKIMEIYLNSTWNITKPMYAWNGTSWILVNTSGI